MKNILVIRPAAPGQPAVLDLSAFGTLGDFQNALENSFATAFPGVSPGDFTSKAKSNFGFACLILPLFALAFDAGARAAKATISVEAAIAQHRAATPAAPKAVVTFPDRVKEQVRLGKTKAEAIRIVIAENPKAYADYLKIGGQL